MPDIRRKANRRRGFCGALWVTALALGAAGGLALTAGCGGGGSQPTPLQAGAKVTVNASGTRGEIPVQVSPPDASPGGTADTPFQRTWNEGTAIGLTAPEGIGDRQFQKWLLNGQEFSPQPAIQLTTAGAGATLTALYTPRAPGPDGFTPHYAGEIDPSGNQPNRLLHWPDVPVRVYLEDNGQLTAARKREVLSGFDLWVRATGGVVAYQVTSSRASAQITLALEDRGNTGYAGQTTAEYFEPGGRLAQAFVVINLYYLRNDGLALVAAHEFGHALGIGGHSSDPVDIMYPSGSRQARLSVRDINTLHTAYRDLFGRSYRPRESDHADAPVRSVEIRCPFRG